MTEILENPAEGTVIPLDKSIVVGATALLKEAREFEPFEPLEKSAMMLEKCVPKMKDLLNRCRNLLKTKKNSVGLGFKGFWV